MYLWWNDGVHNIIPEAPRVRVGTPGLARANSPFSSGKTRPSGSQGSQYVKPIRGVNSHRCCSLDLGCVEIVGLTPRTQRPPWAWLKKSSTKTDTCATFVARGHCWDFVASAESRHVLTVSIFSLPLMRSFPLSSCLRDIRPCDDEGVQFSRQSTGASEPIAHHQVCGRRRRWTGHGPRNLDDNP